MLSKSIATVLLLVLVALLVTTCQSGNPTSTVPTVPPPPPTVPPAPSPTAPSFANTPEGVVSKILYSIQTQDANGYLDALDPDLRKEPNYFMASTFSKGLLAAFGLGSSIDVSKISFRDVRVEIVDNNDEIARVFATGKIRNLAFATEDDFQGMFVTRKIDGTWFVSDEATANAKAIQAAAQATAQAVESECRQVPSKIKFELEGPIQYQYKSFSDGSELTASSEFKVRVTNENDEPRTIVADWHLFLHLDSGDGGQMRGSFDRDFAPNQSQVITLGSDSGTYGGKSTSQDLTFMLKQVDNVIYRFDEPKMGRPIQSPLSCIISGTEIPLRFVRRETTIWEIDMVSQNEGWAITSDDWILHYIDGVWREEYLPIRFDDVHSLHMISPEEGWAVGSDGLALHYINGVWENVETRADRRVQFRNVSMASNKAGWVSGYWIGGGQPFLMQYTDDYWLRYAMPEVNTPEYFSDINRIFMLSPDEAWAVTGTTYDRDRSFLHLANGEWKKVENPSRQPLWGLHGVAPNDIWAVGDEGTIVHYDGNTWTNVESPTDSNLKDVYFVSANEGWAVGELTILHYRDGNWEKQEAPITNNINSISMISADEGWAVGGNTILHYKDDVWVDAE